MSESDGRKHAAAAIGALGMVVMGCNSSSPNASPTASPIAIQGDASGTFTGGGDASTSGLSLAITPAAPSVCPGECVTLAATASGGRAPYAFAWSPEAASDGGDITVCPGQTTTYGVNATDSSGSGGELQRANLSGSANVTVTVDASCSEGGAPVDAGHAGPADTGTTAGPAPVAPWAGCEDVTGQLVGTDSDSPFSECYSPDSDAAFLDWMIPLAKPFVRGQTYDVTITVDTRSPLGPDPNFDVWSSSSGAACQPAQQLTNQTVAVVDVVGGPVTVHFCATAQVGAPALFAGFFYAEPAGYGSEGIGVSSVSTSACAVASCAGDP
jgi:hypothetical protein